MTAANYAGLSRIPLTFLVALFLIHDASWSKTAAAGIVALAIVSDILDGVLARRFGTVSTFGVFLDLTSDKIFVCPTLFLIAGSDPLRLWIAVVVTMREFLVMGVRAYVASTATVIPAMRLGKLKAIVMYPALILVLLDVPGAIWVLSLSAVLAVISCVGYLRRAWPLLRQGLCPP